MLQLKLNMLFNNQVMKKISASESWFIKGVFVFLLVVTAICSNAQNFNIKFPQTGGNQTADKASGIVTNAFFDAKINKDSVQKLAPKFLRWPEGATANWIYFDKKNPATFKVGIHDKDNWMVKYIKANTEDWTVTPEFGFDQYIKLCREVGAEPIVVIGIEAIYSKMGTDNMSRKEVIEAAKEFVKYANKKMKYNIIYWEIGNEDDLCGSNSEIYAEIFNDIVPQLKKIDATIKCGANSISGVKGFDALVPLVQTNADFWIEHSYGWLNQNQYDKWYPHLNWDWTYGVGDFCKVLDKYPKAAKSLFVTELASFAPNKAKKDGDDVVAGSSNVTWKGLLNIQMHLEALSRQCVKAALFWNTRWDNRPTISYNIFSPDYRITPVGLSMASFAPHLYNNLSPKIIADSLVLWYSHNNTLETASLFFLNPTQKPISTTVNLNGFKGGFKHEKWVYMGSLPNSEDVSLRQMPSEPIRSNSFSITLPPLSFTVLDFNQK